MNLAPFIFLLSALWMFSPDKVLFAVASALVIFLAKLSWRDNEPKIIFFGMVFYWLTVCTLLVYGAVFRIPMEELTDTPTTFIYTTYLSLFATFCYCSGILLAIKNVKITKESTLFNELKTYNPNKLLLLYSAYSLFSSVFGGKVLTLGGLSQAAVALIWVKWAFLVFLIVHTLLFPKNQKFVIIILLVEVLLSLTGFWSSFKDYLLMAAAAFLTFSSK
jgi:hypothetical protein